MKILTANGRTIDETDVTHQHWSNIYWYNTVFSHVAPNTYMNKAAGIARDILASKFDGVVLPWKPVYRKETELLIDLSDDPRYGIEIKVCDIIFKGKKIGKILETPLIEMDHPLGEIKLSP